MADFPNIADQASGGGGGEDYILIEDQKASGTEGGTFTSGAWQTRDLNTIVSDTGGHSSLASNQITLAAGTYRFKGGGQAARVNTHKLRLQNITDATTIKIGVNERSDSGTSIINKSLLQGKFTINTSKVLELQHRSFTTGVTFGFGNAASFGVVEIYSFIELFKES